uniref:serine-rich adhesin for platelets-like n=1 Tax=Myxine glutinosa TaxID=7769 RepID=UPI00358ED716
MSDAADLGLGLAQASLLHSQEHEPSKESSPAVIQAMADACSIQDCNMTTSGSTSPCGLSAEQQGLAPRMAESSPAPTASPGIVLPLATSSLGLSTMKLLSQPVITGKRPVSQTLTLVPKRRSSSRSIKRKKFDDELVESSLVKTSSRIKAPGSTGGEPGRVISPGAEATFVEKRKVSKGSSVKRVKKSKQTSQVTKDLGRWKPTDDLLLINGVLQDRRYRWERDLTSSDEDSEDVSDSSPGTDGTELSSSESRSGSASHSDSSIESEEDEYSRRWMLEQKLEPARWTELFQRLHTMHCSQVRLARRVGRMQRHLRRIGRYLRSRPSPLFVPYPDGRRRKSRKKKNRSVRYKTIPPSFRWENFSRLDHARQSASLPETFTSGRTAGQADDCMRTMQQDNTREQMEVPMTAAASTSTAHAQFSENIVASSPRTLAVKTECLPTIDLTEVERQGNNTSPLISNEEPKHSAGDIASWVRGSPAIETMHAVQTSTPTTPGKSTFPLDQTSRSQTPQIMEVYSPLVNGNEMYQDIEGEQQSSQTSLISLSSPSLRIANYSGSMVYIGGPSSSIAVSRQDLEQCLMLATDPRKFLGKLADKVFTRDELATSNVKGGLAYTKGVYKPYNQLDPEKVQAIMDEVEKWFPGCRANHKLNSELVRTLNKKCSNVRLTVLQQGFSASDSLHLHRCKEEPFYQ